MTETEIPEDHPRYASLLTRHRIEAGVEKGITSKQGLIAQGRGEAFDYLLGERTLPSADAAERAAAATLLRANHPVLSVNGNVAALAPGETVELAEAVGADIEVNLFNHTDERVRRIADHLREHGADDDEGLAADGDIRGWTTPAAPSTPTGSRRPTWSSSRWRTAIEPRRSTRWGKRRS